MTAHFLAAMLAPRSIALIGASERPGALGRLLYENMLRARFNGALYPVNPRHASVFGNHCFVRLKDLPAPPDLAVIATPADTVTGLIHDAGLAGIRNVVVLPGGFDESSEEGRLRAAALSKELDRFGMRLIGPESFGIMRPHCGLNATLAHDCVRPGSLALVSQSGAVCSAILDWAAATEIGFSSVTSIDSSAGVDVGELLDYLLYDEMTKSIMLYLEQVRDARGFMSALRAAARVKPVIVLKAGRHAANGHGPAGETATAGYRDAVFDAALARAGAVRVENSMQLFAAARMLATGKRPAGKRLAIISNGRGPGMVAADSVIGNRLELATLGSATIKVLSAAVPGNGPRSNPVELSRDATSACFAEAAEATLADPGVDGLLALYSPQIAANPDDTVTALVPVAARHDKPLITAWLGGASVSSARTLLDRAGIANFLTPESAIEAFSYLARFRRHQEMLMHSVPAHGAMSFHEAAKALARARHIRDSALGEKRLVLSDKEAGELAVAFGLPFIPARPVATREQAIACAKSLGYPVALRMVPPIGASRADPVIVKLNLLNARQVGNAFEDLEALRNTDDPQAVAVTALVQPMRKFHHQREVFVAVRRDSVFGPVIAFGAGGIAMDTLHDMAVALPPLNPALAAHLVRDTRIHHVLGAFGNVPAIDDQALLDLLQRVSVMACLLPWIVRMELNPVLVHPGGATITGMTVSIDPASPVTDLRYRHMAVFPYPVELEREVRLKDGTTLLLRPIRPDDAGREHVFFEKLSDVARYNRFQHSLTALSAEMIARFTQLDYDREMALVAIDPAEDQFVGVARYFPNPDRRTAEFAIVVADAWQGRGLGRILMKSLVACARDAGYGALEGSVLPANAGMLGLVKQLGFSIVEHDHPNHSVRLVLQLDAA